MTHTWFQAALLGLLVLHTLASEVVEVKVDAPPAARRSKVAKRMLARPPQHPVYHADPINAFTLADLEPHQERVQKAAPKNSQGLRSGLFAPNPQFADSEERYFSSPPAASDAEYDGPYATHAEKYASKVGPNHSKLTVAKFDRHPATLGGQADYTGPGQGDFGYGITEQEGEELGPIYSSRGFQGGFSLGSGANQGGSGGSQGGFSLGSGANQGGSTGSQGGFNLGSGANQGGSGASQGGFNLGSGGSQGGFNLGSGGSQGIYGLGSGGYGANKGLSLSQGGFTGATKGVYGVNSGKGYGKGGRLGGYPGGSHEEVVCDEECAHQFALAAAAVLKPTPTLPPNPLLDPAYQVKPANLERVKGYGLAQNEIQHPNHRYDFAYDIIHQGDPHAHGGASEAQFFGHSETREGDTAKGRYHVLLPDGRHQKVAYTADHEGYHAHVSYN